MGKNFTTTFDRNREKPTQKEVSFIHPINRSLWSSVLYDIDTGDGEIVTVELSQLGNIGGAPYWSWYGFGSRVEWCACLKKSRTAQFTP